MSDEKPVEEGQGECKPACSDRTFKHSWKWIWEPAGVWTDRMLCTTCGLEKIHKQEVASHAT